MCPLNSKKLKNPSTPLSQRWGKFCLSRTHGKSWDGSKERADMPQGLLICSGNEMGIFPSFLSFFFRIPYDRIFSKSNPDIGWASEWLRAEKGRKECLKRRQRSHRWPQAAGSPSVEQRSDWDENWGQVWEAA